MKIKILLVFAVLLCVGCLDEKIDTQNKKISTQDVALNAYNYMTSLEHSDVGIYYYFGDYECVDDYEICIDEKTTPIEGINQIESGVFYLNDAGEMLIVENLYIDGIYCEINDGKAICNEKVASSPNKENFYGEYFYKDVVKLSDGSEWYVVNYSNLFDKYILLMNKDNEYVVWDENGSVKYENSTIETKINSLYDKFANIDVKKIEMLSGKYIEELKKSGLTDTIIGKITEDFDPKKYGVWIKDYYVENNNLLVYNHLETDDDGKVHLSLQVASPKNINVLKYFVILSKENISK